MKILVVDDDPDLLAVTGFALERAGFLVLKAGDGQQGLELFRTSSPEVAVLDINMAGMNGFELAKGIRELSDIPIIMLTVRGEEQDVVRALDIGADDYLTKPFSPKVLVARIRALLRRAGVEANKVVTAGVLKLNPDQMTLSREQGDAVRLTPLEVRLLLLLFSNAGQVVSTERILAHVWGSRAAGNSPLLKQLVHRLRQKIEYQPGVPCILQTVPNVGYRLEPQAIQQQKAQRS